MKKSILYICKYLNFFTNNKQTPKQEAETILRYLLSKNTTIEAIDIIDILEELAENEMTARRTEANKIARKISLKYPLAKSTTEILVNDPVFSKPIKNN